jgi:hypothetical protein
MTLNDLLPDLLGRIEENCEPGAPIFWSQTYEILPELVDAMFEAALITGVVQVANVAVTLPANTTYFSLNPGSSFGGGNYGTAIGIPKGAIASIRMKAPWTIRKVSLKGLGGVAPGWQKHLPGTQLKAWFPLGVSGFGIWPQFSADSQVLMDFMVAPVTAPRPYSATLRVPFQQEFTSAFPEYAAAMLRTKELGAETEESKTVMNEYLEKMKQLSLFQNRVDSLIFTPSAGANVGVNRREVV